MTQITSIEASLKYINNNKQSTQAAIKEILNLTIKEHNKLRFSANRNMDKSNSLNNMKMSIDIENNDNNNNFIKESEEFINKDVNNNNKRFHFNETPKESQFRLFDSKLSKVINIKEYLKRIIDSSELESSTLVYTIALLKSFIKKTNIYLTVSNVYSLLFISLLISVKLNEDINFTYENYALIGGFDIKQLIIMENSFLNLIEFEIVIKPESYERFTRNFTYNFKAITDK